MKNLLLRHSEVFPLKDEDLGYINTLILGFTAVLPSVYYITRSITSPSPPFSKMVAEADQGTISGGSISRIVRNTLFYMCTNFGAFMQILTIDLKYQTTLLDY